MKKIISVRLAGIIVITFLCLLSFFHLLILLNILPSDMVWGGRVESAEKIFILELVALVVTILFLGIIIAKLHGTKKNKRLINVAVWFIFGYFCLNVLGNLTSENLIEKFMFTPVAVIIAFFTLRLAIEKS